jgi:hypothetical protein
LDQNDYEEAAPVLLPVKTLMSTREKFVLKLKKASRVIGKFIEQGDSSQRTLVVPLIEFIIEVRNKALFINFRMFNFY